MPNGLLRDGPLLHSSALQHLLRSSRRSPFSDSFTVVLDDLLLHCGADARWLGKNVPPASKDNVALQPFAEARRERGPVAGMGAARNHRGDFALILCFYLVLL
jgi:hypothetical protein